MEPEISQPRMFGGHLEPKRLPWKWAVARLTQARNYWIATTRPNGQPHCRPVWGVWHNDALYFSTGSLAWKNLASNPAITVHLESGSQVVILEGVAEDGRNAPGLEEVACLYHEKYHWTLEPGDVQIMRPQVAFGWLSDDDGLDGGAAFHGTATRWQFAPRV
ncbi:MAG TPA: pyridoxamine 5'-phosphate oxidase family protein [Ktedonobacterales bacterium]|jgi:hypothetical protein